MNFQNFTAIATDNFFFKASFKKKREIVFLNTIYLSSIETQLFFTNTYIHIKFEHIEKYLKKKFNKSHER